MKKKIHPLSILLSLTALASSMSAFAQDNTTTDNSSPPNNTANPSTQPPPASNSQDGTKRTEPSPQASRIKALEATLRNHQLGHQINTLSVDSSAFLTLYRNAISGDSQGCVILLPGDNEHPDWPTAVGPLRNALPHFSWCTIAVEIPDIQKRAQAITPQTQESGDNSAALPNQQVVFDRLQAVMDDAKGKGVKQFAFVGYQTGAAYALTYLANNPEAGVALAMIDPEAPRRSNEYDLAQTIRQVNLPILDYYYGRSMEKNRFALWRKQAANQRQAPKGSYMQLDAIPETKGARDGTKILVQYVRGFLKQNTSQIQQTKALPEYKKGLFYKSPVDEEIDSDDDE